MKIVIAALAFVGIVLVFVPLGTALGALSAMIVEYWFPVFMPKLAAMFGFEWPWELGAACGFIGAFFRSVSKR